ncbi:DNA polymerase III subunit alpha [Candidatus Poribacteria bacterium]|jgi:error-prone DNA polymerase|nr:DNA polymerase III subunit alpha [Candidatus Poribacteria bacterium]MBT5711881.1 DNA polymerase III subunit alpha [Candidatus Poribacteria bacterium]MBT7805878.1 DNA polymerase III subunit alpha [Candidatus Poribacteria bacterium]
MPFAHLHVHSAFSFLDGASDVRVLAQRCADLGMPALALTDHHTVAGVIRFRHACEKVGVRPIVGAEIALDDASHLTLLARNVLGYENLCRLLTKAHLRHERGSPQVCWEWVEQHAEGLLVLTGCARGAVPHAVVRNDMDGARRTLDRLVTTFGREACFVEIQRLGWPGDRILNTTLCDLAEGAGVRVVGTNNVHAATREDFYLRDIMTCIRTGSRIDEPHAERRINAEEYLKSPDVMRRIFKDFPEAIANTLRVVEMCEPFVIGGREFLPDYPMHPGEDAGKALTQKTLSATIRRYGEIPGDLLPQISHELGMIMRSGYAGYFLIVEDVVRFAREKGMRYAGRGSAGGSVVVRLLEISRIDPRRKLMFSRFMNTDRMHDPDIDLDFTREDRDKVTQYVTDAYGEDYVATVCTFQRYKARGAFREVGKTLGFREDELGVIAKRIPFHSHAGEIEKYLDTVPELRALNVTKERLTHLFHFCREIAGQPRHIGTHCGGVVISGKPIYGIAHLQEAAKGVNIIPFDKRDLENVEIPKLDLLCLPMFGAVRDTEAHMQRQALTADGLGDDDELFEYDAIPTDDPETFELINTGETAGAFNIQSPAQRVLQAELNAQSLDDIIVAVALVRPGPMKDDGKRRFLDGREDPKSIVYPHPLTESILRGTNGVLVFQEQVNEIGQAVAGLSAAASDKLRRVIGDRPTDEELAEWRDRFRSGAAIKGVSRGDADRVFDFIGNYTGYGFAEAHAVSFGDTAYRTAYLLQHHPAPFYAAMLNHQPMGYFPTFVLMQEAKRRGIDVLPLDVEYSRDNFTAAENTIRTGWRAVHGLSTRTRERMETERYLDPFVSLTDFATRVEPRRNELEMLAYAGAFDRLYPNRRALLWALAENRFGADLGENPLGLEMPSFSLPDVEDYTELEKCSLEWKSVGFCAKYHPMEFYRPHGTMTCAEAKSLTEPRRIRASGVTVNIHKPPTRSGKTVVFLNLSDETGIMDAVLFEDIYKRDGAELFKGGIVEIEGWMELERGKNLIAASVKAIQR